MKKQKKILKNDSELDLSENDDIYSDYYDEETKEEDEQDDDNIYSGYYDEVTKTKDENKTETDNNTNYGKIIKTNPSLASRIILFLFYGMAIAIIIMVCLMSKTKTTTTQTLIDSIDIDITSKTEYVGNTLQLHTIINPSNAVVNNIKWTSSNKDIADVNNEGLVTIKKSGTVTITVNADGKEASATINVNDNNYTD